MRKGTASIEVMLILPLLLSIIIILLDALFIFYQSSVLEAELLSIQLSLAENLAQNSDANIISAYSDLELGNVEQSQRNSRRLSDNFHLGLSESQLKSRFQAALKQSRGSSYYRLTSFQSSLHFDLLRPYYQLDYQLIINSPFASLTGPILNNYKIFKGEMRVNVNSQLQEMNDIVILMDRLAKVQEVIQLIRRARGEIQKCLAKINYYQQ